MKTTHLIIRCVQTFVRYIAYGVISVIKDLFYPFVYNWSYSPRDHKVQEKMSQKCIICHRAHTEAAYDRSWRTGYCHYNSPQPCKINKSIEHAVYHLIFSRVSSWNYTGSETKHWRLFVWKHKVRDDSLLKMLFFVNAAAPLLIYHKVRIANVNQ